MNGYGGPTRLLNVAVAPQNGSPDREPSVSVLAFYPLNASPSALAQKLSHLS